MPKLDLGAHDSAIIIREDGTWETLLGMGSEKNYDPDAEVPLGVICAAALTIVLNNESLMEELIEQVETAGLVDQIVEETGSTAGLDN